MKILVAPRDDTNPYQELLYRELADLGVEVSYLGVATQSYTVNLLIAPLELAARRLSGTRLVHLHWVYYFVPLGAGRAGLLRRFGRAWFGLWLRTLRGLGLRLVWTAHNVLPVSPVFDDDLRARRALVKASDLVLAHSQATLDELAALGMRPRRTAVIPHGPFSSSAPPESKRVPGTGSGPRRLLFFGRIRPYKGVDNLLAALAMLPADSDVCLTVAGECNDPELAAELTELAARSGKGVALRLERIPEHQIGELLQDADVVVLPYRWITTSGSGMLALGHGRPLIVPDLPALAELPDAAVFRYDSSLPGLAGALTDAAFADGSVLAKMSAAAYAAVAENSWREIARATLDAMEEVLRSED